MTADRSTRNSMSTPDNVLSIDAPGTAEGAKFLEAHRIRDWRFERQSIGAYIPYVGVVMPLNVVYVTGVNPSYSGVIVPDGNDCERSVAEAIIRGDNALATSVLASQGDRINENVVDALVLLGRLPVTFSPNDDGGYVAEHGGFHLTLRHGIDWEWFLHEGTKIVRRGSNRDLRVAKFHASLAAVAWAKRKAPV